MDTKDQVLNASTGLMAIRDLATYGKVPINIHLDRFWIHVIVGFGTPCQKKQSWYAQDLYRLFNETDSIYKWIEDAVEEVREELKTRPPAGIWEEIIND